MILYRLFLYLTPFPAPHSPIRSSSLYSSHTQPRLSLQIKSSLPSYSTSTLTLLLAPFPFPTLPIRPLFTLVFFLSLPLRPILWLPLHPLPICPLFTLLFLRTLPLRPLFPWLLFYSPLSQHAPYLNYYSFVLYLDAHSSLGSFFIPDPPDTPLMYYILLPFSPSTPHPLAPSAFPTHPTLTLFTLRFLLILPLRQSPTLALAPFPLPNSKTIFRKILLLYFNIIQVCCFQTIHV